LDTNWIVKNNPRIFTPATTTDSQRIVARITRRLRPGAIILLHDGNVPVDRLIPTVQLLLDTLREREYQVVRLDRLLA
jgi:peptidoglycan/xylan/chitin deacetylase (PgdA/CDA1 family)